MSEYAKVTAKEALAWAGRNRVPLPEKNRIAAINEARDREGLPQFSVIAEKIGEPLRGEIQEKTHKVIDPSRKKQGVRDLRDILFQELTDLRAGHSEPQQAQAVAKLAAQVVATYKIEMTAKTFGVIIDGTDQTQLIRSEGEAS